MDLSRVVDTRKTSRSPSYPSLRPLPSTVTSYGLLLPTHCPHFPRPLHRGPRGVGRVPPVSRLPTPYPPVRLPTPALPYRSPFPTSGVHLDFSRVGPGVFLLLSPSSSVLFSVILLTSHEKKSCVCHTLYSVKDKKVQSSLGRPHGVTLPDTPHTSVLKTSRKEG